MTKSIIPGNVTQLIWKTEFGNQSTFERQFIEDLFQIDGDTQTVIEKNNPNEMPIVAVYSSNKRTVDDSLSKYIESQDNLFLVHLSNESLLHSDSYYGFSKGVLRPYFNPGIKYENVFTIPLGYQTGFKQNLAVNSDPNAKNYMWVFVGQLKSDRYKMVDALSALKPYFLKPTDQFGGGGSGFSVNNMIELYGSTNFVPCPSGNINPDTFRVMECLECGCIPVIVTFYRIDYFKYIYGDHPFIIGKNWKDVASKIQFYMNNPKKMEEKRNDVALWYENYKISLKSDIRRILTGASIDELESRQFYYQKYAKKSLYIRLIFWFHFRFVFMTRILRSKINPFTKHL